MASKKEMGNEIFAMRGVLDKGEKVGFLKKWPYQFNAYENGIFVRCVGKEKYINAKDIEHIYRNDNILDDKQSWRTLNIYYYENGERRRYRLADDNFPNLIEKIEELYKNEWKKYGRDYPESVKWFIAVISNWLIVADRPHDIFGPLNDSSSFMETDREIIKRDWGIHNKSELINMCHRMINCPNIEKATNYFCGHNVSDIPAELMKVRTPIMRDYNKTMKAYDIYRVILLANFGYTAKFFTFEEAMDWCLKAGSELQRNYRSWDDFYENYLLGYCFWSEEDADLIGTHANRRKRIYEEMKKYPTHPWQISWNTMLRREW